ncbi:hypothetical protein E2C01_082877 [Portunus trituberculatus]|uniref:Uncharacterized protein n=1 Tax=Portunus trituberculatus TaxID=210409 RepID=A0A5B7J088_PORTR|nr:hypothetical protein [Portunus trituberculatus]
MKELSSKLDKTMKEKDSYKCHNTSISFKRSQNFKLVIVKIGYRLPTNVLAATLGDVLQCKSSYVCSLYYQIIIQVLCNVQYFPAYSISK